MRLNFLASFSVLPSISLYYFHTTLQFYFHQKLWWSKIQKTLSHQISMRSRTLTISSRKIFLVDWFTWQHQEGKWCEAVVLILVPICWNDIWISGQGSTLELEQQRINTLSRSNFKISKLTIQPITSW